MINENFIEQDQDEEDELYEHFKLTVEKGQYLLRIDKYLMNRLENKTRTKIQAAADSGMILVNQKPVKSNYKVKPLDVISIVLPHPPRDTSLKPENIPLNIMYEDEDLLIVNKNAGMVVHPGVGNHSGTLINALMFHLQELPLFKTGEMRPGLVHRIDKNTSGILVIAKNEIAMIKLAKQFYDHSIDRKYIALVWGELKNDKGTITGHIARNLRDRKVMDVFPDGHHGKHAITHYTVLERFKYTTLVECKLETGRTHQIRVHFKHIGHPLFNDNEYGGDKILRGTNTAKYKQFIENCFDICPRQALHAKQLGLIHPSSNKYLFFDSEIAADMHQLINKWRTTVL